MLMAEAGRPMVERSPKHDAHRWARNVDRRTTRSTGQVKYGNTRVQEIVSGTFAICFVVGTHYLGSAQ